MKPTGDQERLAYLERVTPTLLARLDAAQRQVVLLEMELSRLRVRLAAASAPPLAGAR